MSTIAEGVRMDLPPYESVNLKRSPLVLVGAQINFEEVAHDVSHSQARRVQRALTDGIWTKLQAAPQIRTTVTPTGAVNEPTRNAYRLQSADETWSLVLNPDSVILETKKYTGWADMSARLGDAASAIGSVLDPAQQLRLGLRYVDQVPLPEGETSWQGLIPDTLLSIGLDPRFGDAVIGSDQRHLLQIGDDVKCMLRHGLLAGDNGQPGRGYLLDFDVFSDSPRPFDASDIMAASNTLHGIAGSLFRASISDELFERLKG